MVKDLCNVENTRALRWFEIHVKLMVPSTGCHLHGHHIIVNKEKSTSDMYSFILTKKPDMWKIITGGIRKNEVRGKAELSNYWHFEVGCYGYQY